MQEPLSLNEFLELAKTAKRVAVYKEISADRLTPISIVDNLANEMLDGVVLESGLSQQNTGRYSFIAFGSIAKFSVQHKLITKQIGSEITTHTSNCPFTVLRQLSADLSYAEKGDAPDFLHGAVGFVSYDAIRLFESIPNRHDDDSLPDMLFKFYQTTLIFDHMQHNLIISTIVEIDDNPEKNYYAAQEKITTLIKKITTLAPLRPSPTIAHQKQKIAVDVDISDAEFIKMVERAKEYITKGDAFQIVLSRCFQQQYTATPFDIYRALRKISPAPYMFYLPVENNVIIGASPEKLISVYKRQVDINPIAGTRSRTIKNHDEHIANDLLNDKKERAEHMMLVDLARNDLGAVCKPGSVKVKDLLQVKHFSHVSHLTSTITGQLRDDKDALDAFTAAFPAGTLSGAPKIRAMQLIDELEISKRGLYGGAICRLDYQGNLDSCIAIRMALLREGVATVRTGAGIVYDSNPSSETNETRQKAQGILEAITTAEEELA